MEAWVGRTHHVEIREIHQRRGNIRVPNPLIVYIPP